MLIEIIKCNPANPAYWYTDFVGKQFNVIATKNNSDRGNGFTPNQYLTAENVPGFNCTGVINEDDAIIIQL